MPNAKERLIELLETVVSPNEVLCDGEVLVSTARVADHLIAHGVTVQEWIPVTERLPAPYTPVLTCRQSFDAKPMQIKIDQIILPYGNENERAWVDDLSTWKTVVTHWMPLPQAPKGE